MSRFPMHRRVIIPVVFLQLLLLIFLSASLHAQQTGKAISGSVTDKTTGEPMLGVNVFIERTTTGTTTNEFGEFEFFTTLEGDHRLHFSFVGYETVSRPINLDGGGGSLHFDVELAAKTFELDEVEVAVSNVEWLQKFNEFQNQFIGRTSNAGETEIENRWVLELNRDESGNLVATAAEPLLVLNRALGYRLYVELNEFVWEHSGVTGLYKVNVRYEEMEPEGRRDERRWERNRRDVWQGSMEHFLHSLYHNRLREEHFTVYAPGTGARSGIEEISEGEKRLALMERGIPGSRRDKFKGFSLRRGVEIDYGRISRPVRSGLIPRQRDGFFFVDSSGNLLDPGSIQVYGEWANHRVADMLPLDYNSD